MENIEKVIRECVPHFIYENEGVAQPKEAAFVWAKRAFWVTLATAILYIPIVWFLQSSYFADLNLEDAWMMYIRLGTLASFVGLVLIYFTAAHLAFHKYRFDAGEDMFMFKIGIIDEVKTIMQYDRAQIVSVSAWPSARKRGLARCRVHMLSSSGTSVALSGFYNVEEMDAIGEEVLNRIKDGRYDYRKSTF